MFNAEIVIRTAVLSDISSIIELLYLKAEFDGCPKSLLATSEQLSKDLFGEKPLASVLLAEVSGKTVGFATYHSIYSTFLVKPGIWLDDLYVKSEFRGQKIGFLLIVRLCEIAHEKGCGRIDWTVATDNDHGIQFYEKIGANVMQTLRLCRLNGEAIAQNAFLILKDV